MNSNVLLYDHQTESLWSQLMDQAVAGPAAGKKLRVLPSRRLKWKTWQQRNPSTYSYWFAWQAFHRETAVFKAD